MRSRPGSCAAALAREERSLPGRCWRCAEARCAQQLAWTHWALRNRPLVVYTCLVQVYTMGTYAFGPKE